MNQIDYKIQVTGDGSPSLCFKSPSGDYGELMHSRDGAITETLFIYQPVLDALKEFKGMANVLSIGLGLGYNEILCACFELQNPNCQLRIFSYESVEFLRTSFQSRFQENQDTELNSVYQNILDRAGEHFSLPATKIDDQIKKIFNRGDLIIRGSLNQNARPQEKFNGIFYDAFSSNTTPELWTEEFLNDLIELNTQDPCCLSTYAATGKLKRALLKNGFHLEKREGFANKRESTLAHRFLDQK